MYFEYNPSLLEHDDEKHKRGIFLVFIFFMYPLLRNMLFREQEMIWQDPVDYSYLVYDYDLIPPRA
jgi:hypothetical protein